MRKYNFTIIASGFDSTLEEETLDRLFEAGCDDATLSVQKGLIILEFDREAKNFISALFSAIENVQKAGGQIERIEPDHLVSASEIAKRCGLSRAAISLYATGARAEGFPHPVALVTTESPLWDWAEVSSWFYHRNKLDLEVAVRARLVRNVNRVIDGRPSYYPLLKQKLGQPGCSLELA
jgi:predicted DNA-binding transcriptional regulator AlpA